MKLQLNIVKIKAEMERLGMNQSELAKKTGLSRQRISAILQTRPPLAAVKIAKVFNVHPKDLIQ